MTKDGYTFELQISLKELDPLIDASHAIRNKAKYNRDVYSLEEIAQIEAEQAAIHLKMKNKYFEIKDKELVSDELIDQPIAVETRIDETGEIVTLNRTPREMFEQEGKDQAMLARLKDCVT